MGHATVIWFNAVFGATHTLNGDGEMTGIHWVRDLETIAHPILITNTATTGIDGNTVHALPYGRLAAVMAKYGRSAGRR